MELIDAIENELSDETSFESTGSILVNLDSPEEVYKFTHEIGKKKNVKIKEIDYVDEEYVIEVTIFSSTHSLF